MLTNIIAVAKAVNSIRKLVEAAFAAWIEYDIKKMGDIAEARKQEFDALNNAMKRTTNDTERLALLRALDRTRV